MPNPALFQSVHPFRSVHRGLSAVAECFGDVDAAHILGVGQIGKRSEEHTSELQSLMRISYAVFCLKKKKSNLTYTHLRLHETSTSIELLPPRYIQPHRLYETMQY